MKVFTTKFIKSSIVYYLMNIICVNHENHDDPRSILQYEMVDQKKGHIN